MIDKDFIEKIEEMAEVKIIDVNGKKYSTGRLSLVSHDPRPDTIELCTLTGLVNYLNDGIDGLDKSKLFIHVKNYNEVFLLDNFSGDYAKRTVYVLVKLDPEMKSFSFGTWFDQETFIINLQSQFVQNDDLTNVLRLVGNMKAEKVVNHNDNGVTQTVAAKKGITLSEYEDVPNPVFLKPFRTFREIEQPESAFIFRVRDSREGIPPACALFEADGSEWRIEAIERIKNWLLENIKDVQIIA
jgi:hypothetical protein